MRRPGRLPGDREEPRSRRGSPGGSWRTRTCQPLIGRHARRYLARQLSSWTALRRPGGLAWKAWGPLTATSRYAVCAWVPTQPARSSRRAGASTWVAEPSQRLFAAGRASSDVRALDLRVVDRRQTHRSIRSAHGRTADDRRHTTSRPGLLAPDRRADDQDARPGTSLVRCRNGHAARSEWAKRRRAPSENAARTGGARAVQGRWSRASSRW